MMGAYKLFSEIKTSKYDYIKKKKRWKAEFEDGYELSDERISLVEACLEGVERIYDEWFITRLARLIRWADPEEVLSNWNQQLEYYRNGNRPKGSPSYEQFVLNYGKQKGTELFNEFTSKVSETNKNKGVFSVNRYIQQGYSQEEATEIVSKHSRDASVKRWKQIPKDQRSMHIKSINPLSKHYKGYEDMDTDTAEEIRQLYIAPCIRDLQSFIKRFGETEGAKRYQRMLDRRKAAHQARGTSGYNTVVRGSASKMSLMLFDPIISWLIDRGYDSQDIYIGKPGHRGEWWIRDDGKYYLYDMTLPNKKIIIEYHGVRWHPYEDGTWNAKEGMTNKDPEKIRIKDLHKKQVAENQGYAVLEIWSDEDIMSAIDKCKRFIIDNE